MNGITYFKFVSPYDGDITKNCALSGSEVDNNFFTLENRDIKTIEVIDDKIVVTLMDGTVLATNRLTENCIKDLSFEFDEVNGVLTITKDGVTTELRGFATDEDDVQKTVSVDGTLKGNGLFENPIGINQMSKTGQYRPVKRIINTLNGEKLPSFGNVYPGDRFLTVEKINEYGFLYNYEGLEKIARQLRECGSQWRIPTKEDWDDMLNSIEPNEDYRNHSDARSNKYLGQFAGKLLKATNYWKNANPSSDNGVDDTEENQGCDNTELCCCGKHRICHPNYCGEFGSCHHRQDDGGIDKYGFKIMPAGYANEAKDYMYFTERAYFWTATNHEYRDAYIKCFLYNKSNVLQDIMASDNYMSVRLVKDYNGENFNETEDILGSPYPTVLMPSIKNGKTIWTSANLYADDCGCGCKHVLPNDGEGMEYTMKFYTNEWTGKDWIRKEMKEGESVVTIDNAHEYRIVGGELIDVSNLIYNEVIETINPIIENIETEIQTVDEKINNEIERSTNKDNELEETINGINERLTSTEENVSKNTQDIQTLNEKLNQTNENVATLNDNLVNAVNTINQNMADGFNTINENVAQGFNTINEAIEAERQIRSEKDKELDDKIHIQEGSSFDPVSSMLTLKSKGGENDIQLKLNFNLNLGTF